MADYDTKTVVIDTPEKKHSGGVYVGKIDKSHTRIAKRTLTAGAERTAGMLIDTTQISPSGSSSYKHDTYRTSYAYGLSDCIGAYDVPIYFMDMNQKNGGIIYWPTSLHERYSWYRYFARTSPYVSRALDLLTDLPLSKLSLTLPKMSKENEELGKEILRFFNYQLEKLNMFELFQSILYEYYVIGNVAVFFEYNEKMKMWERATILPPEETYFFQDPFTNQERVEYKPERLIQLILSHDENGYDDIALDGSEGLNQEIVRGIPEEIKTMVRESGAIKMDNDPLTGSFVHHIARRKFAYEDMGVSILERILVPLLIKEHYKYTQLSLASRNMTPKNVVYAPNLLPDELEDLRTQVDLSYLDPEYSIVTNYEVTWNQIGAQDRLLDLSSENENLDNQIFAGLGVTREILTGEAQYSGTKINLEILNTTFMQVREMLRSMVEKKLFIPLCEQHGWYEVDKNNIKTYFCPQVGFNRLTIRDNSEVFDSLFQLYQKGSLPVSVIYELFNLDAEEMDRRLRDDLFTARDATFNRLAEEANSWIGQNLGEKTDIMKRAAEYLKLKLKEESEGGEDSGSDMSLEDEVAEMDEQPTAEQTVPPEDSEKLPPPLGDVPVKPQQQIVDVDGLAKIIAESLSRNATPSDIDEAIRVMEQQGISGNISVNDISRIISETVGKNATADDINEGIAVVEKTLVNTGKPVPSADAIAEAVAGALPSNAGQSEIAEGIQVAEQALS